MVLPVAHVRFALWPVLALALAGCGGGADPPPAGGPARDVAATMEAFEQATAARDYTRICRDLLSGEARRQAGGEECPRRLRRAAQGVRRPSLEVERIDVRGNTASVQVIARSAADPPARETVELVRQEGRFRIASLGS